MADLSVNKNETIKYNEGVGQNPVFNGTFESAPAFTAATTASARWIDGTAAGSTTLDTWGWEIQTATGTVSAQYDTTTANSGTNSLRFSTLAVASRIDTGIIINASTASNVFKYGLPVIASSTYKISYAMKTTLNSGASSSGAFLRVTEFNSAGTAGTTSNGTVLQATTSWTSYSFNVTVASTAAYISLSPIIIGNTGTATMIMDGWIDDIVVTQVSQLNGVDLPLGPIVTPGVQNISGPKIWS